MPWSKALDPIRLFGHLQQLQQAVFRCAVGSSPVSQKTPDASLLRFALEGSTTGEIPSEGMERDEEAVLENPSQESKSVLDWRRPSKDPFAGQWEQILSWMQADPTRSSGDIFRQLQSLFPQRYRPLQIRTLQRGMRKIRTRLLTIREEQWQTEVIHRCPTTATEPHQGEPAAECHVRSPVPVQPVDLSSGKTSEQSVQCRPTEEEPRGGKPSEATRVAVQATTSARKQNQAAHPVSLSPVAFEHASPSVGDHSLTIEQAIESYLQEHRRARHSPKTLEWHQTALRQFQQYLLAERHLLRVSQITETDIHGWFAFLQQTPTSAGKLRSARTIETYARSVRAFCNWLVHREEIARTPLGKHSFPWTEASLPPSLPPTGSV